MSYIYLIRHGQAGTRDHYDALSDVGVEQAQLLGEYLASQRVRFEAAYHGGLVRQTETARYVSEAYERVGLWFPDLVDDPGWREFDLDAVYKAMAPQLCAADPAFRREYEALEEQVRAAAGVSTAAVHRRWMPCDMQVVESWIQGRFEYDGESWPGFIERVSGAVLPAEDEGNVVVFTSATPTAVWAGKGLDIQDDRVLRIAGVLYNTAITVLRVRGPQVRLFSLNGVPHLNRPELRTHR